MPPRHSFALNAHKEWRCTGCPQCEKRTRLRKFALLIGVAEYGLMVLGKTCRYCPPCDFIIAHQDELESDRVARTAGIAALVQRVFGDVDAAREWLLTPNPALEGQAPLRLLRTGSGAQLVEAVLLRIEYGVYE